MVWNKKNDEPEVMVNTRIPLSAQLEVDRRAKDEGKSKYAILREAIIKGLKQ
jgi:hypothetical protein